MGIILLKSVKACNAKSSLEERRQGPDDGTEADVFIVLYQGPRAFIGLIMILINICGTHIAHRSCHWILKIMYQL